MRHGSSPRLTLNKPGSEMMGAEGRGFANPAGSMAVFGRWSGSEEERLGLLGFRLWQWGSRSISGELIVGRVGRSPHGQDGPETADEEVRRPTGKSVL